MIFENRRYAANMLSKELKKYKGSMVIGIPRGGVVVAREIADNINGKLDVVFTKKLRTPFNKEVALGAVNEDGKIIINPFMGKYGIEKEYIEAEKKDRLKEIKKYKKLFRGNKRAPVFKGKTVILTDDGVATGATIKAAIEFIKKRKPEKLILALPVAAPEIIDELKEMVDKLVCLYVPVDLIAVGRFYRKFEQVENDEVKKLLNG